MQIRVFVAIIQAPPLPNKKLIDTVNIILKQSLPSLVLQLAFLDRPPPPRWNLILFTGLYQL